MISVQARTLRSVLATRTQLARSSLGADELAAASTFGSDATGGTFFSISAIRASAWAFHGSLAGIRRAAIRKSSSARAGVPLPA